MNQTVQKPNLDEAGLLTPAQIKFRKQHPNYKIYARGDLKEEKQLEFPLFPEGTRQTKDNYGLPARPNIQTVVQTSPEDPDWNKMTAIPRRTHHHMSKTIYKQDLTEYQRAKKQELNSFFQPDLNAPTKKEIQEYDRYLLSQANQIKNS